MNTFAIVVLISMWGFACFWKLCDICDLLRKMAQADEEKK